jgi:membrane-associated phospholipid phosphatase
MNTDVGNLSNNHLLIRAIHTAVKGRARYKVNGLHHSEACKNYLEFRLLREEIITHALANPLTGNILVFFQPNWNLNAIALLLHNIVLDYQKEVARIRPSKADISIVTAKAKHLPVDKVGNSLVLLSGAVCTLALCSGLLHRYGLDQSILLAIQKLHTPFFDRIMLGITFLGDPLVIMLISGVLEINRLSHNRFWQASTLSIATASTIGLNYLLKVLFGRARPALWKYIIDVGHHSFPSGHAMISTAIYGFIGYISARQFPQHRRQILTLTAVLIILIGLSRLYLGVHWPTDVVVGYAVGLVCLTACIFFWESEQKYLLSA